MVETEHGAIKLNIKVRFDGEMLKAGEGKFVSLKPDVSFDVLSGRMIENAAPGVVLHVVTKRVGSRELTKILHKISS